MSLFETTAGHVGRHLAASDMRRRTQALDSPLRPRRRSLAVLVVLQVIGVLLLCAAPVSAEGVVVESYTGSRPGDATRWLAPLYDELSTRGFASTDALARSYDRRVSRVSTTPLPDEFSSQVERGHKAWIEGRFGDAIDTLQPLVQTAHASAASIAQSQAHRQKVFKALVALALSHQRRGDLAEARATLTEILRSFPDAQLSRGTYGPDAYQLFESVRRDVGRAGRARLSIKVPDAGVVFINERFENVGSVSKTDLIPGPYRVFVQVGKKTSRTHTIELSADDERILAVDLGYDVALHTAPWTGFEFATDTEREKNENRYATRFAGEAGADAVVVVGVDVVRGRPALVGSLVDMRTSRDIRRASLALDPEPSETRVRALARFLGGDDSVEGLDIEVDDSGSPPSTAGDRRWMLWSGIGGVVVGTAVGGGLALTLHLDARAAADELERTCAASCTPDQVRALQEQQRTSNRNAIIAGVSGGAIVVTGIAFIIASRFGGNAQSDSVALVPARGGVVGFYTGTF